MFNGIYDFAYCPNFDQKLDSLASIAAPEPWAFPGDLGLPILRNYVNHTFKRIGERVDGYGKPELVSVGSDGKLACYNTGLFTRNYEPIYGYFQENRVLGRQLWALMGFCKESDYRLKPFSQLPERATYFSDISDLVFDYRFAIRIDKDHILNDPDNLRRLPIALQNATTFDGAIAVARKKVSANYRLAIPQYYEGKVQLLIPLGIDPSKADVALVITKADHFYIGHTCLTVRMAYNNARLIAKPDTEWLRLEIGSNL